MSSSINTELILVMKVGVHASESLCKIINRKQREIDQLGYCFWGYGGTLCHPIKLLQPKMQSSDGCKVLFSITNSPFHGNSVKSSEFSVDGSNWKIIPPEITVVGSKYALVLTDLKQKAGFINLAAYRVASGPSAGKLLSDYVRFRVDKALAVRDSKSTQESVKLSYHYDAKLITPFAVFLR